MSTTEPRALALLALLALGCKLEIELEPDARAGAVALDAGPLADAAPPCEGGFRSVADPRTGHCYTAFLERRTYAGAVSSCAALGTELASVTSAEENAVIAGVLPTIEDVGYQSGAWLGADDRDGDLSFTWVSGEPFDYRAWRPGEPSFVDGAGAAEDCLTMDLGYHIDGTIGYWNDLGCLATIPFVCERR